MRSCKKKVKIAREIDSNFEYSFGICHWCMRFLGIWPIDNSKSTKWKYCFTLSNFAFGLLSSVTSISIASTRTDVLQRVMYLVIAVFTTMKILVVKWNKKKLKYLLRQMAFNWEQYSFASQEEKEVMSQFMNRGRLVNIIMSSSTQVGVIAFVLSIPINFYVEAEYTDNRRSTIIYFEELKNHPNLIPLYMVEVVCCQIIAMSIVTMDTFFMIIIIHTTGQFILLANKMESSIETINEFLRSSSDPQGFDEIKFIIDDYVRNARFVKNVEECFNVILLLDFLKYLMQYGLLIYLIMEFYSIKDVYRVTEFLVYTAAVNFLVFLPCFFSQQVKDASERIGTIMYHTNWDELNPRKHHIILLTILRSQRPIAITVGKFFNVTLTTYTKVLESSLSYASVLLALK